MAENIDIAKVDEKIAKGEELTPEEVKAVMSAPPEGYEKVAGENEDIFKDAEVIEEKKEEVPPKEEKKPEAKKEPEPPPEPPKEDTFDKIEKELAKPDGKEDLTGLTDREKAYFWQMRRDRRARQKAEEERDVMRLERVREKAQAKPPEPEIEEDIFKDRDPEDFITVEDIKKYSEKVVKKGTKKEEIPSDPVKVAYLKMCDKEAAKQFTDYEEVMAATEEIIAHNNSYQAKIVDALVKGDNPAVEMYQLIKGDPEFPKTLERLKAQGKIKTPEPPKEEKKEPSPEEVKKTEEAKSAQKRLEENANKPKTSGHAGGAEVAVGEVTLEYLTGLSDREFAKLPKQTRDKYLKMFGA